MIWNQLKGTYLNLSFFVVTVVRISDIFTIIHTAFIVSFYLSLKFFFSRSSTIHSCIVLRIPKECFFIPSHSFYFIFKKGKFIFLCAFFLSLFLSLLLLLLLTFISWTMFILRWCCVLSFPLTVDAIAVDLAIQQ